MTPGDRYPTTTAGPFPTPPTAFTDRADREIRIHRYGNGPLNDPAGGFDRLVEMYTTFDPEDRAQGIPPGREDRIRSWLDTILTEEAVNVIAWADGAVAGHAMLVPDDAGEYELAIFVHQEYQEAGIGKQLIRCLLGEGARQGVSLVWLTVERWNEAAISLYRAVGFETTESESFELEMRLRLGPSED